MLHSFFLLMLSPSCFIICGHHLSPRMSNVFSLQSSVSIFSMSQPSTFAHLPLYHMPLLLVYFIFSHYASSTLLLCHQGTSVHLLPPPLEYWYTSFSFLAGPGPIHEIAVSAFSRSPLGRAHTFSFLLLPVTPHKSLSAPPPLPRFLALAFSLFLSCILLLSCTPQTFLM